MSSKQLSYVFTPKGKEEEKAFLKAMESAKLTPLPFSQASVGQVIDFVNGLPKTKLGPVVAALCEVRDRELVRRKYAEQAGSAPKAPAKVSRQAGAVPKGTRPGSAAKPKTWDEAVKALPPGQEDNLKAVLNMTKPFLSALRKKYPGTKDLRDLAPGDDHRLFADIMARRIGAGWQAPADAAAAPKGPSAQKGG